MNETIDVTTTPFGLAVLRQHKGRSYNKVTMTNEHVIVESPFYATHTYTYEPPELWDAAVAQSEWPSKYKLIEV